MHQHLISACFAQNLLLSFEINLEHFAACHFHFYFVILYFAHYVYLKCLYSLLKVFFMLVLQVSFLIFQAIHFPMLYIELFPPFNFYLVLIM